MKKEENSQKSIYVNNKLWNAFQITTSFRKESMSSVIEEFIRDYCVKYKMETIEAVKDLIKNNE